MSKLHVENEKLGKVSLIRSCIESLEAEVRGLREHEILLQREILQLRRQVREFEHKSLTNTRQLTLKPNEDAHAAEAQIRSLLIKVETIERELSQERRSVEQRDVIIQGIKEREIQLEEELGEKRRIHSRLQTKVDEYEIAIKKMQQRFSNVEGKCLTLKATIDDILLKEQSWRRFSEDMLSLPERLNRQIEDLEGLLALKSKECCQQTSEIIQKNAKISELMKSLRDNDSKLQEERLKAQGLTAQITSLCEEKCKLDIELSKQQDIVGVSMVKLSESEARNHTAVIDFDRKLELKQKEFLDAMQKQKKLLDDYMNEINSRCTQQENSFITPTSSKRQRNEGMSQQSSGSQRALPFQSEPCSPMKGSSTDNFEASPEIRLD